MEEQLIQNATGNMHRCSLWTLGAFKYGKVRWNTSSSEKEAYQMFESIGRISKVLFDMTGLPVKFLCIEGIDAAIILTEYRTGEPPNLEAVAEAVRIGNQPFVPPDRNLASQWLLKRSMQCFFSRRTVEAFCVKPHRGTSLCFFDESRHTAVRGHVAVTIDDAPCRFGHQHSRLRDVLDMLRTYDVQATFMTVGKFVDGHEEDLVELLKAGHELGNHGMLDRPYDQDSPEQFAEALDECSARIRSLQRTAGVEERVRWFRAPHGRYTRKMEEVISARQLTNTMCDTYASCPVVQDGEFIGNLLAQNAQHGSIILIHMPELGFREWCFSGLHHLLEGLKRRGLRGVTVGELAKLAQQSSI
eukprot:gnl/TRDRNA2_/TRDRNA2_176258_c0_seq1.p1 gnl/TRDRNA2_/TRDRNA2_176258_c0~~gnl/TRDRNA2_/TRDRNA2_176258_c0_seq1.p1  ORF type:complete len:374 (+),score=43.58 gnl/TRDRNA2_/TRDRNA2_176258_c0_seq1:47-1123(+)